MGTPWNSYNVNCMLSRLTDRWEGGRKFCLTDLRHSFATEVVKASKDLLGVAALLGHKDGAMVAKVYAHLAGDDTHLRGTLESRHKH
jgi:site-specific recombinase XerC